MDLDLSINNGIISSKIYDKRDDFDFAMRNKKVIVVVVVVVNYPHLDGDVPRATSYGVYSVEFVVVLWNRVYNLCTLYVLKGGDRG